MTATKKPTGLTIKRNGSKFSFSWKRKDADHADGQQYGWQFHKIGAKDWPKTDVKGVNNATQTIGAGVTSKEVTLDPANFYPYKTPKLNRVQFRVRGNRKKYKSKKKTIDPGWSDWAEKEFTIRVPAVPSVTYEADNDNANEGAFNWKVNSNTTGSRVYSRVYWESCVTKGSPNWKNASKGTSSNTSGAVRFTETSATDGLIRYFRIRSQGPAGQSDWSSVKSHAYTIPNKPKIKKASAKRSESGYKVNVVFSTSASSTMPIDSVEVQYSISPPTPDVLAKSGASWTTAITLADKGKNSSATFEIDTADLGADNCLFVRVNAIHDKNTQYGDAYTVVRGVLKSPVLGAVDINTMTGRATVNASYDGEVDDVHIAVLFKKTSDPDNTYILGVIPNGDTNKTVTMPALVAGEMYVFGCRAFLGDYEDTVTTEKLSSNDIWNTSEVPMPPERVSAQQIDMNGTVRVTWEWSYTGATGATISWSDHEDAWESTDEPDTYSVGAVNRSSWNISNLKAGSTYYFRVRFDIGEGDTATHSDWSEMKTVVVTSAPLTPELILAKSVASPGEEIYASWSFTSGDNTPQMSAVIHEATITIDTDTSGRVIGKTVEIGDKITEVGTEAEVSFIPEWTDDSTHYLCLKITSEGETESEWSDPAELTIVTPPEAVIGTTSLVEKEIDSDTEESATRTALSLAAMPLTVAVSGGGEGSTHRLSIERSQPYHVDRPDGSHLDGFTGECIYYEELSGEGTIEIDSNDLNDHYLDDGASYNLILTVTDSYGQNAFDTKEFEVHWDHQADVPGASVEVDMANMCVRITPTAPAGYVEGDTADIYRVGIDGAQLIYEGATFGETYVDPYPCFGENGGHLIVTRTANGDITLEDGGFAVFDTAEDETINDTIDVDEIAIDAEGMRIMLPYDISMQNSWEKDFERTVYLGGSIQGDWNAGVTRDLTVSTKLQRDTQNDRVILMRRLAEYPGVCHVRTPNGSSFNADVQVKEDTSYDSRMALFSLTISKVDSQYYEGMTLSEWENATGDDNA